MDVYTASLTGEFLYFQAKQEKLSPFLMKEDKHLMPPPTMVSIVVKLVPVFILLGPTLNNW